MDNSMNNEKACSNNPNAPHGFNRDASHNADRYVCDCESWVDLESEVAVLTNHLTDLTILHQNLVRYIGWANEQDAKLAAAELIIKIMRSALEDAKETFIAYNNEDSVVIESINEALALTVSTTHLDQYVQPGVEAERAACVLECENIQHQIDRAALFTKNPIKTCINQIKSRNKMKQ